MILQDIKETNDSSLSMICLGNYNIMNLHIKVFQQPLPLGVLINDFNECEILKHKFCWLQQRVEKNIWLPK